MPMGTLAHVESILCLLSTMSMVETLESTPTLGNMEQENANGTLRREFLETTNMCAVNTKKPMASGKTWTGGNGGATRVDYIVVPVKHYKQEDQVLVSCELRRRLRLAAGLEINDHIPVLYSFHYEPWGALPEKEQQRKNRTMMLLPW